MVPSMRGIALGCVVVTSTAAVAQQPAENVTLEEIVVTAQKRLEREVDVPISVTAITAETLENSGIEGVLGLAQVTPGMVVNRFGVLTQPTIRGVTTRIGENSVATYVDGFYLANGVSLDADFNNVARVDVLKGPQGTLFGRNVTGGAILITTRDPAHEPTFSISSGIEELDGNYDGRTLSVYASAGLSESVAFDVAGNHRESNGWIYNITGGDPVNDQQRQNLRARVLYEPNDAWTMSLTGEYGEMDDPTVTGALSYYSHRALPAVFPPDPALPAPSTPNITVVSKDPLNTAEWKAGYGKIEYTGETVRFLSLSSYRVDDSKLDIDFDGSIALNPPTPGGTNVSWEVDQTTIQQEFNLASAGNGRLDWLVGIYLFDDEVEQFFLPNNVVGAQRAAVASIETTAASAFADFTYAATDALSLTAGVRYSYEEKEGAYDAVVPSIALAADADFSDTTPRVVARYALDSDSNVYVSWSKGFKSGLFNTTASVVSATEPESISAYEIGYKTQTGSVSFDTAAFFYDWKDILVARFDPTAGGNVIQNAAAAEIYGIDAQLEWAVTDRLSLRASAAYTHGEYTDFPSAAVTVSAQPDNPLFPNNFVSTNQDWSGNPTIRTPEWTANLGWNYRLPVGTGAFMFTGNVYYTSEFEPNSAREHPVTGEPDLTTGPYTLVNLGLSWVPTERWNVTLYSRNVTDEQYVMTHDANAFGQYRAYGEPRVLGLRIGYSYK
jgi:iron complex outermembrane recepter protein